MAPAYKLVYFETRGAAEKIRYILKYSNIDFEDVRIKKEDWPKLKESAPFGHLPYLEHNGKKLSQSISICRYVGKIAKLAGNDDWENLEIDAIVDTIGDLRSKFRGLGMQSDEETKKQLKETLFKETVPYYLTRIDKIIEKNNGYLAVGRLTWADFLLVSMAPYIQKTAEMDKYPNIAALIKKVEALPAIKKWIEERPHEEPLPLI